MMMFQHENDSSIMFEAKNFASGTVGVQNNAKKKKGSVLLAFENAFKNRFQIKRLLGLKGKT